MEDEFDRIYPAAPDRIVASTDPSAQLENHFNDTPIMAMPAPVPALQEQTPLERDLPQWFERLGRVSRWQAIKSALGAAWSEIGLIRRYSQGRIDAYTFVSETASKVGTVAGNFIIAALPFPWYARKIAFALYRRVDSWLAAQERQSQPLVITANTVHPTLSRSSM